MIRGTPGVRGPFWDGSKIPANPFVLYIHDTGAGCLVASHDLGGGSHTLTYIPNVQFDEIDNRLVPIGPDPEIENLRRQNKKLKAVSEAQRTIIASSKLSLRSLQTQIEEHQSQIRQLRAELARTGLSVVDDTVGDLSYATSGSLSLSRRTKEEE